MTENSQLYLNSTVIVLSQTLSPCGQYLVCGNNYGDVAVFSLTEMQGSDVNKSPANIFTVPDQEQICSMTSTSEFCIVGTCGSIYGYDWNSLIRNCKPPVKWTIFLPNPENIKNNDVNALFVKENDGVNYLYAGCGDNMIHVFSLEDGRFFRSFEGHSQYIHSICYCDNQMASCSEDGSVRLWDLRQKSMTTMIEPSSNPDLARPHIGKWVGDVDLSSSLLVCGGASRAALWDLRIIDIVHRFRDIEDSGVHITKFFSNEVFIGGTSSYFYKCNSDGEVLTVMKGLPPTVFSAVYTDSPKEMLSVCGAGPEINLSIDLINFSQVLTFSMD